MAVDINYFLTIIMIFIRMTSFFMVVRVFYPTGTPMILKVVFGIIISFAVAPGVDGSTISNITNNFTLAFFIINEIICGLVLGYITNLIFDVVTMAGSFMDMQIGLSMMNVVDPTSKNSVTMMSNLSNFFAIVIFFIIDGHHILIKSLVQSFSVVKIGAGVNFQTSFESFVEIFTQYFIIGIRIAIPIILILLITDLCMSLVSRTVPSLNVMILGMPIKIMVGLVSFVVLLPVMAKLIVYGVNILPDSFDKIFKYMQYAPLVLIFADDGDKTEQASPKKLEDARKKGQIARSKDVSIALTMVACTMAVMITFAALGNTLKQYLVQYLQAGILQTVDENTSGYIAQSFIVNSLKCILPFAFIILIAGVVAGLMQTRFLFTTETLKPKFSKLNPIAGFKNIFSKKSVADLIKNLAVVTVISLVAYNYIVNNYKDILTYGNLEFSALGGKVLSLITGIFVQISIVLILIAAIDYFVQIMFFKKDMKMSKQEVKDEYKQMEGDPQIKNKIKQKQREIASRRMMAAIPDATVVITNPTHLAIAIKYEDGKMEAPRVVAKGADFIALKIKEIAKENAVPIMENKPIARMLYEKVEIDEEVPQEMYQAVAEILAIVYNLNKK